MGAFKSPRSLWCVLLQHAICDCSKKHFTKSKLDLIGTVLLPGSIVLLIYMVVKIVLWNQYDLLGILMTVGTLGLPGMIIVLTTGHIGYAFWMIIYFLALPIWHLILPIYAFSKFDNFTWGHTRQVLTDPHEQSSGHEPGGSFIIGSVPLKRLVLIIIFRWDEWERSNRLKASQESEQSSRELRRTPKIRDFYLDTKRDGYIDPKNNQSFNPGKFEYLRDPAILKSLNLDAPTFDEANNFSSRLITQLDQTNELNASQNIAANAPFANEQSIINNGANVVSDANQLTPADANDYTATGITKRISYDVIQLPRKPRRLQKKSLEYMKANTVLKLKTSSNLARRSREFIKSVKHFGSRPIPQDFVR